jgi:uncharacterized protein YkwD
MRKKNLKILCGILITPLLSQCGYHSASESQSYATKNLVECIDGDAFSCQMEEAVVKYTNEIRVRNGKKPLTQDFRLSYVARDWSNKQGIFINHFGFPWARASVFRSRFPDLDAPNITAENVAMNSPSIRDRDAIAKGFADQWEHSFGHLRNILGDHNVIGIGIVCRGLEAPRNSTLTKNDPRANDATKTTISDEAGAQFWATCTGTQIFAQ